MPNKTFKASKFTVVYFDSDLDRHVEKIESFKSIYEIESTYYSNFDVESIREGWTAARPSLKPSDLNLKRDVTGTLTGRPYYGVEVDITNLNGEWLLTALVDGIFRTDIKRSFKTRRECLLSILDLGNDTVTLRDSQSRKEFEQTRCIAGRAGICRSMESYYTM